ncbi:3'-5'-exoribonuclease [Mycoemilia scoparia]|uniref:3'-5'-exoribonuclease n=1 Tax=Mycoemilia scoparia TaxID=417184 RepID=A0A9W8DNM8_9FUNG|nr:3'-5'-exoribonuclease [Mycoemilia scoparia]
MNTGDRRRVNGPERSVAPISVGQENEDLAKKIKQDIVNDNKRQCGRNLNQPRPLYLKTGLVSEANGSAYYEQDKIRVACAVYGPRPIKKSGAGGSAGTNISGATSTSIAESTHRAVFTCDFKYSAFSCSWRKSHMKDSDEKEIAMAISQALCPSIRLELYPKSSIDMFITVIESDGRNSTIAAAINCASAALANAGIEMYDMVISTSIGLFDSKWVIDCPQVEEDQSDSSILIALMPSANEITQLIQQGKTQVDQVQEAIELCTAVGIKLYAAANQFLSNSLNKN